MEKTRIIIADPDLNYVIPLQAKFAEELYGQIELELITDPAYFRQVFSSPQKAEILILSEELYTPEIRRHNISHVFLMTEYPEDGHTAELNIVRLYKYTSIKEIFTEIIGVSAASLDPSRESKQAPQIVAVCSASGGVGKSTVALGISGCLARQYKRVLYIGADRLQTFQRLLENSSPISSMDVYSGLAMENRDAYSTVRQVIRNEGFDYLPPFRMGLLSLGLNYSVFERMALGAKNADEYDYIIVDTDSAFDEAKASLMNIADRVIIVTRQDEHAVYATNLLVSNIDGLNPEKFLFVCNDFDRERENALVSSALPVKFVPDEYVAHMNQYDQLRAGDFAKNSGIQKLSVLIM